MNHTDHTDQTDQIRPAAQDKGREVGHILRGKFCGSTTVGERGQIVIPAEARKAYGVDVGDKLMVFIHPHHDGLFLVKAETVTKLVTDAMSQLGRIIQGSAGDDDSRGEKSENRG